MVTENKKTISVLNASILGLILGALLVALLALPFCMLYGLKSIEQIIQFFKFQIFVPSLVIGILIHEAIHGITWYIAGRTNFKDIQFGFKLKLLTPYAHCKVPINIKAYRLGVLMPFLIMGILPYIYSIITENHLLLGFSLFFSFGAIGDLIILWITKSILSDKNVQDHPSEGGVIIID